MINNGYICIGKILRPHGVRGLVKLFIYTEDFPELCYIEGREQPVVIELLNKISQIWVAKIDKVDSRSVAETYKNLQLYKPKETLENEYYLSDLINCEVIDECSEVVGVVKNIYNFGAGDILEIQQNHKMKPLLIALDKQFVKSVDLEKRQIYIIRPTII